MTAWTQRRPECDSTMFTRALRESGAPPHETTVAEIGQRISASILDYTRWIVRLEGMRKPCKPL